MLETLQSARDGLYLSYVGRDPRDNAHLPPSVLISELLETIDLTATAGDAKASEQVLISHPLQPFASGNFAGGSHAGFSAPGSGRRSAWPRCPASRTRPSPCRCPSPTPTG